MVKRVALISGANRGIGLAIAQRLLSDGWQLSLGIRSGSEQWQDNPDVHIFEYDALEGNETQWVEAALAHYGRIDAIIPNAGIMVPKSVIDVEDDELDAMWKVNVRGPQRLAKAAFSALSESGQGRIIIMASLSGKRVASAGSSAYSVSKFAVLALAHGLRQAGFDHGIRTTAICPGPVATDMGQSIGHKDLSAIIQPEEIAELVSTAIHLPNTASVAEIPVHCRAEATV
ncbi:putative oxidoreductase [Carnimonas sp. R-84981]|uniref:SDR family NAD(P)-dependent oxidoreductase n=1 Tax=Carnimonas bestiolae TaxID=3402172 RepID=UPI003EDB8AAB